MKQGKNIEDEAGKAWCNEPWKHYSFLKYAYKNFYSWIVAMQNRTAKTLKTDMMMN